MAAMTVICPNCRHRFQAPECCTTPPAPAPATTTTEYSIILDGPQACLSQRDMDSDTYFQQQVRVSVQGGALVQERNYDCYGDESFKFKMNNSGGGLVQQRNQERSLIGVAEEVRQQTRPLLIDEETLRRSFEQALMLHQLARLQSPPSGCQELPGTRRENNSTSTTNASSQTYSSYTNTHNNCSCNCSCKCCSKTTTTTTSSSNNNNNNCKYNNSNSSALPSCCCNDSQNTCCNEESRRNLSHVASSNNRSKSNECKSNSEPVMCIGGVGNPNRDLRIEVNATLQFPSTLSSPSAVSTCKVNITATTSTTPTVTSEPIIQNQQNRTRQILNGGGIVSIGSGNLNILNSTSSNSGNRHDEEPSSPLTFVTACPWGFDGGYDEEYRDAKKLADARKLLQSCAWYHEGISWQQSEELLKKASVGKWLLRDSSDSRYTFAISVQTSRGPTSVRVYYQFGKFRLDAEPRIVLTMPMFENPIRLLEYYVDYADREDEAKREVWVDYNNQVYAKIFMSEPLVKGVQSLSHIARLAVNKSRGKLSAQLEKLPPVITKYLDDYPYKL